MADSQAVRSARYKKSKKYRKWLKEYQVNNKQRLAENTRRWRGKPGNIEKERIKQVSYRLKIKRAIFDEYGNKCQCCGETNSYFLTIDHVNNDGYKEKNKSGKRPGGRMLYHKIMKENFPSKYQILCMNCNFGKSKNSGICPHEEEVENGR